MRRPMLFRFGFGGEGSPSRLSRTLVWFTLALALQATIVSLAVPARTQNPPPALAAESMVFGRLITPTIRSAANVSLDGTWSPQYRIEFDPRNEFSQTVVVGHASRGLEFVDVETNQGFVEFDPRTVTITLQAPLSRAIGGRPLVYTPTLALLRQPGVQFQGVSVRFPGFPASVITDTMIAEPPPLTYDVRRSYPGLVRLGNVITYTWQVGAASRPISRTFVIGLIGNGVYRSIGTDGGICLNGAFAFICALGPVAPGARSHVVTYTAFALNEGRTDQVVGFFGGGDSLVVPSRTVVEEEPVLDVVIDIKPFDRLNRIGPNTRVIPVAVFSSNVLDVPAEVDQASLEFGRTGQEESLLFCNPSDLNRDGIVDLVCLFERDATGFRPGDREGVLTGHTFSGVPIRGTDFVTVVP